MFLLVSWAVYTLDYCCLFHAPASSSFPKETRLSLPVCRNVSKGETFAAAGCAVMQRGDLNHMWPDGTAQLLGYKPQASGMNYRPASASGRTGTRPQDLFSASTLAVGGFIFVSPYATLYNNGRIHSAITRSIWWRGRLPGCRNKGVWKQAYVEFCEIWSSRLTVLPVDILIRKDASHLECSSWIGSTIAWDYGCINKTESVCTLLIFIFVSVLLMGRLYCPHVPSRTLLPPQPFVHCLPSTVFTECVLSLCVCTICVVINHILSNQTLRLFQTLGTVMESWQHPLCKSVFEPLDMGGTWAAVVNESSPEALLAHIHTVIYLTKQC